MDNFSENMETKRKSSVPFIDICAYVECSNNRQEVSLYSFPKKSNPLCAEWLSRICNPALKYYSSSTLRRMGVCEKHFTPEMFKSPIKSRPNGRKTLKRTAIPEPSDHLVQKWREKLKQFMATRQIKRDNNIEEKEEAEKEKGREKEEEPQQKTKKERQQQQRKEPGKEQQQQQRNELGKEQQQQQQQRKELGKEGQQQQRKGIGKEGQQQQRKGPGKEGQQQQRKGIGKEGQQQQWKEPEIEEHQQQQQEMENEKQLQQRQEMENEKQRQQWQDIEEEEEEERQAAAKPIEDQEIEMFVTKPTRVYSNQSFSFSDDEDDGMEWVSDEPPTNCVALGESPLKKTPCEMKLERENVKLKRDNKCLRHQLKYLKRKLKRSIISRDRLLNELRKISK